VLKEATILAFRKAHDPAFPLLPVLLPDVDRAAFDAHPGFSALRLAAIQAFAPGSTPQAVADAVRARLAGVNPPLVTPLDRLTQALETRIGQGDAQALERACEELLGEAVAWSPALDRVRQRARVIARAIARGQLGRMATLAGMTRALGAAALAREQIRKVLDLAASIWVEEEVAARLRRVIDLRTDGPVAAAINSERIRHGARMAVWRAQLPDIPDNVYWVAGGGSDNWGEELAERLCAAYHEGNKDEVLDAADAADVLAARTEPVFFVVPPPIPDLPLLTELHARFGCAVFLLHTGGSLPAGLPNHVMPLSPGLRLDLEKQNRADYLAALESIR
jgi:hypothetical protein